MHKKYLALAAFAVSTATAARKKVLDAEDVPAVCATLCQFALDQTRTCDDENRSKDDFLLCVCGAPDAQLLLVQCSTCISTGVASPAAGVSDGASPPVVSLERRRETKRNLARSRVYRSTRVGKSRRTDVDGDGGDSISHEARSDGTDSVLASSSDEDERDRTRNRSPLDKLIKQCDFKDSPTTLPPPAIPSATLPPAAPTSALPVVPIIVPPVSTDPISIPAPSEPPLPPSTTQPAPPPTEPAVPSQAPPPEETSTELPSPPPVSVPSDPGARPPVPTTSVEPPVALPSSDLPTSPPVVDTTLPPSLVPSPTSSALSTTSPPSPPVGPPSPPVIPPSGESPGGTGPGDIGSSPPLGPLLPLPGGGNLDDPLSQPLPVPVGEPGQADPLPPAPPVPSASPGSSGPSVSSPSPSPSPSAPPPAAGSGGGGSTSSSVSGVPAQTTPLGPLPSVPTAGASRLQAALLRSILATLAAGVIG